MRAYRIRDISLCTSSPVVRWLPVTRRHDALARAAYKLADFAFAVVATFRRAFVAVASAWSAC